MLIAITGDTHGRIDGIRHHLQRLKPDYLIHTGDYYTDGKSLARGLGIGFTGVRGNCDTGRKGKLIEVLELVGYSFCILHGHQHKVKHTLNHIYYYSLEIGAQVVVFGHTHVPCCEFQGGIYLLNPGSPSLPRIGQQGSFIMLEVGSGIFKPEVMSL
jgi:putative phosphoesterase